jgi:hypothetical protein
MVTSRGEQVPADDPAAMAFGRAGEALHRELICYQRNTQLSDGGEVAQCPMTATAGAGIAILVLTLIERLRDEILPGSKGRRERLVSDPRRPPQDPRPDPHYDPRHEVRLR